MDEKAQGSSVPKATSQDSQEGEDLENKKPSTTDLKDEPEPVAAQHAPFQDANRTLAHLFAAFEFLKDNVSYSLNHIANSIRLFEMTLRRPLPLAPAPHVNPPSDEGERTRFLSARSLTPTPDLSQEEDTPESFKEFPDSVVDAEKNCQNSTDID